MNLNNKVELQIIYEEILVIRKSLEQYNEKLTIWEEQFWLKYNSKVKELEKIMDVDLSKYLIEVKFRVNNSSGVYTSTQHSGHYVTSATFNLQINSLIARLEAGGNIKIKNSKLEKNENLIGNRSVTVNNNIEQSQEVTINVSVQELNKLLDKSKKKYNNGSKEMKFIDKLKNGLKTVKDVKDIIMVILGIAEKMDVSISDVQKIIS